MSACLALTERKHRFGFVKNEQKDAGLLQRSDTWLPSSASDQASRALMNAAHQHAATAAEALDLMVKCFKAL